MRKREKNAWRYRERCCVRMKEKIKIISDGRSAEVYVDGKKVPCTDMELHFSGHVGREPMITVDATWIKKNENDTQMLNDDRTEILTEGIKINC